MTIRALPSLRPTFLTRSFWLLTGLFALLYILLQIYLLNIQLINQTLLGTFPLSYKSVLISQIILGYWSMFPLSQAIFTLLSALFVGGNLTLLIFSVQKVRRFGRMKITLGGSSVAALASAGCPSCGITALSLLGPSSTAFTLLLHNVWLQGAILLALIVSFLYNLKQLQTDSACVRM